MTKTSEDFTPLFAQIDDALRRENQEREFTPDHPWHHRLELRVSNGLLDVEYQGEYYVYLEETDEEIQVLEDLGRLLASPEVAPHLHSFTFRTAAVNAGNGICHYSVDALATGEPLPNLKRLSLDEGFGEHGMRALESSLGDGVNSDQDRWYSDNGFSEQLLAKAPALEHLLVPSAPSAGFFQGEPHGLLTLRATAGIGVAEFIPRLSSSTRFPALRELVFTDDDWENEESPPTSFEEYREFFQSPVARQLESIHLFGVSLSDDEINALLDIRSEGIEVTQRESQ